MLQNNIINTKLRLPNREEQSFKAHGKANRVNIAGHEMVAFYGRKPREPAKATITNKVRH